MIDLRQGDCLEVMRTLEDNSVHACVTDPPYGLSFMGKKWDYDVPTEDVWREVLRVLKPGGFLLSFSGTRTYHRMTVRIEDAGFEIRDMIQWIYGSGFPKSHDVSKAIDKEAGAERARYSRPAFGGTFSDDGGSTYGTALESAPITDAAKQWEGFGTALKPANEPICVARKPLIGTVAQNVLAHGCGGLNIDGCRVRSGDEASACYRKPTIANIDTESGRFQKNTSAVMSTQDDGYLLGRWPANVVHDGSDEVMELFPQAGGGYGVRGRGGQVYANGDGFANSLAETGQTVGFGDSGSAARFFYTAKSNSSERNKGVESYETVIISSWDNEESQVVLRVDTGASVPMVTAVYGTPHNDATEWNTWLFGSKRTGRSLLDLTFTIETGSSSTTTLKTWNYLASSIISGCMAGANSETANGLSHAVNAGQSIRQITITSDQTAYLPGVGRVALQTPLTINVSERRGNHHNTVKPVDLMRWLVRLVCPPCGVVLDPYTGSGTTGVACRLEGFGFVGIELNPEYIELARQRIAAETPSLFAGIND